jgi:hypothetical protein
MCGIERADAEPVAEVVVGVARRSDGGRRIARIMSIYERDTRTPLCPDPAQYRPR